ncbi:MAG: hypothetical protein LAT53_02865 [Idiomarina sp.]|nr:hypothetical protein [Idiomarina sp.]
MMNGITPTNFTSQSQSGEQLPVHTLPISLIIVAVILILYGVWDIGRAIYGIYQDRTLDLGTILGILSVASGVGILRNKRFWYLVARIVSFLLAVIYAVVLIALVLLSDTEYVTFHQHFSFGIAYVSLSLLLFCWMFRVLVKSAPLFAPKKPK